ncbi:MAG: penicillin-insensitive murein endopeptidase [Nannocystaceae bacterium]|nr:penicillin-insensitive murein endopeptidase [Nannocystaceae bacterium]
MPNDEHSDDELPADISSEDAPVADDETSSDDSPAETSADDGAAESISAAAVETPRSKIGVIMFASAGALWGLFGMMRCNAEDSTETPSAAVTNAEQAKSADELPSVTDDPQPADALPDSAPEPAAETPQFRDEPVREDTPSEAPIAAGDFDPRPNAATWARNFKPPSTVKYTVRRGGTLENVANLYKIFHHEITELNPGVALKKDLPPKSAVVVYRAGGEGESQSIGGPSSGKLAGGVPMMDGPGRMMKMIGWKSFATANTIAVLDNALRHWASNGHKQPVLVGNMSSRSGGRLSPHSTHQSGRDVDLGYPQTLPSGEELNWRVMNRKNLDAKECWALMQTLVQTGQIEVIYVDREIQKLLHDYAVAHKLMSKGTLKRWMEYPSPTGSGSPVIQHVKGHADHMHARFKCQPHETQCKSRKR